MAGFHLITVDLNTIYKTHADWTLTGYSAIQVTHHVLAVHELS
nr:MULTISPECIES: hypothetical protein [unclassified Roseibium]